MSYTDERTIHQFNKYGFMKVIIFLAIIISIIIYRVISKIDFISIIFLLIVPIVSIILLVKQIKKKHLAFSDIINGIITGDERIVNIIDASGMKAMGYGTSILFVYFMYGTIRFSTESVILEFLLFLLVCFDITIEGRFINKSYVACTDDGFEEPYYDDNRKKKEITKRIIKSWVKYAIIFSLLDVITGVNVMTESLSGLIFKYGSVLLGEMILCLIFAIMDILIMKLINRKIYKQME